MPDRPDIPEEAVEALMRRRVAENFGPQYDTLHGWPKFLRDRPADSARYRELAEGDLQAAAPALRNQGAEEAESALAKAKERQRHAEQERNETEETLIRVREKAERDLAAAERRISGLEARTEEASR